LLDSYGNRKHRGGVPNPIVDVNQNTEIEPTPELVEVDPTITADPEAGTTPVPEIVPVFNPATSARNVNVTPHAPDPMTAEDYADKYKRLLNTFNFIMERHTFDAALVKQYRNMAGVE